MYKQRNGFFPECLPLKIFYERFTVPTHTTRLANLISLNLITSTTTGVLFEQKPPSKCRFPHPVLLFSNKTRQTCSLQGKKPNLTPIQEKNRLLLLRAYLISALEKCDAVERCC
jgi:hypothetical protein